jgi:hypothetical protein
MFEDAAKIVGSIVRYFVVEVIFDFVLFQVGRGALLVVTLGRYPTRADCERSRGGVQCAGFLTFVIIWLAIAVYNNVYE